jgi:CheY-like chemotaxis protein
MLPTVLVADDDALVRTVLSRMLDKLGCQVLLARDGTEAIHIYEANHGQVDLLLIDMRMPGADGSEVVRHIRNEGSMVKMILMGGGEELRDIETHLAAGFTSVLPKPFDISTIRDQIGRLLDTMAVSLADEGTA